MRPWAEHLAARRLLRAASCCFPVTGRPGRTSDTAPAGRTGTARSPGAFDELRRALRQGVRRRAVDGRHARHPGWPRRRATPVAGLVLVQPVPSAPTERFDARFARYPSSSSSSPVPAYCCVDIKKPGVVELASTTAHRSRLRLAPGPLVGSSSLDLGRVHRADPASTAASEQTTSSKRCPRGCCTPGRRPPTCRRSCSPTATTWPRWTTTRRRSLTDNALRVHQRAQHGQRRRGCKDSTVAEGDVPGTAPGTRQQATDEEAVWRDLVARFDAPAPADGEARRGRSWRTSTGPCTSRPPRRRPCRRRSCRPRCLRRCPASRPRTRQG